MSYALSIQPSVTISLTDGIISITEPSHAAVTKAGKFAVSKTVPDIPNSQAALFMIDVEELVGSLTLTLQCYDVASNKFFDYAVLPVITGVGQAIYPPLSDHRFYQAIPSGFRVKYEITEGGKATFSIGINAIS